ncbi:MAG: redoxin domain-containing protein [Balneolaceae bacterium]|nr:redoxin domain-containing protein [Balneolaceae bacterium]
MNIGDTVENFTLKNTGGEDISLFDTLESGDTLILFFPLAFSSVCTEELCKVRDNLKMYNAMSVNVLGISVDSFFTLNAFKKANNLSFTLLSDFNKNVSKQFDALYDDFYGMKGVSKRAAFVVNRNKKVEYAEVLEDAGKIPDFSAIQAVLS